ncbi:hypothetical protein AAVH_42306 [Aphelenchoides avenae]|nr:hypothetical protein AAVH_42306 [Aphelenchus avenae]
MSFTLFPPLKSLGLPIANLAQHVRDLLSNIGISTSTTVIWRYVGKPEEFDKNVADLGRKFAWRVFELLDKIRDGDYSNVEDGVLKRLRKVRHRLEKYWARVSSTTSRPASTTTPFAEAGETGKEL